MAVRIKICGITNVQDAVAAVDAGANALGFMFFHNSNRNLSFDHAASIIREVPPFIAKVGVFVNPTEQFVRSAIERAGIDTLQFHGEESPEFCAKFPLKIIKAFRIRDQSTLDACAAYRPYAWLLDSYVGGAQGGTGVSFDWNIASEATKLSRMIVLAGGLRPDNVADAVRKVAPYAVDVSSGVEAAPGKKDHQKIRHFVTAVRTAQPQPSPRAV